VSDYEAQLDVALRPLIDAAKLVVTRTAHLIIAVVELSRPCSLLHRASTSSHAAPEAARRAGPSPAAHLIIAVVLLVVAVHLASAVLRYYFRFSQYYFRLTDDALSGLAVTTSGSFNTVSVSTVIISGFSDTTSGFVHTSSCSAIPILPILLPVDRGIRDGGTAQRLRDGARSAGRGPGRPELRSRRRRGGSWRAADDAVTEASRAERDRRAGSRWRRRVR